MTDVFFSFQERKQVEKRDERTDAEVWDAEVTKFVCHPGHEYVYIFLLLYITPMSLPRFESRTSHIKFRLYTWLQRKYTITEHGKEHRKECIFYLESSLFLEGKRKENLQTFTFHVLRTAKRYSAV